MRVSKMGVQMAEEEATVLLTTNVYRHASNPDKQQRVTIKITEAENTLFRLLKECIAFNSLKLGGWVRDKLLNVSSKDIDIALDSMTGIEFCNYLNAFTEQHLGFHKTVGIVKRRPEQSKHLETATLNILGFDIDFVNLRSEDYAQDSRIPVMKIGTPLEDAMRRDFTINSLFYNISGNVIEDYTGKGMDDLKAELIRACSPAFGTFLDDPLRIIRAARFSARLGYRLDDDIMSAGSHPEVLKQLQNKVARPRIAQELYDMLSKGDVPRGFELMKIWGVLNILTRENHDDAPSDHQIDTGCKIMSLLRECLQYVNLGNLDLRVSYLAAFCSPLRDEPMKEKCTYIEHLIKYRLRLPNKLASGAKIVVDGSEEFRRIVNNLPRNTPDLREQIGGTIRLIGPLWKEALLLAIANEVLHHSGSKPTHVAQKYSDVVATIYQLKLEDAYLVKAPITGTELMNLLPGLTPGPKFKEALDFQINHLLRTPSITKEQLLRCVLERFKTDI
ncbi:tRNA nucleotidyltransferase/poly(A) polymerase family domain containing protein [Babesia divergens]|uniref:tRNA nucleotidyltransferase/poly(A) polymerase family domain containing protein n=1 Tax=Babesia divergens TaxID=32595 RepID=A0AAD9GDD8_BABDI|nr:tRNA nucleotidyltransferase/poly(A) polymerase family domain containing protein [Babesia divergens]